MDCESCQAVVNGCAEWNSLSCSSIPKAKHGWRTLKRPHLDIFLQALFQMGYEIVIWSEKPVLVSRQQRCLASLKTHLAGSLIKTQPHLFFFDIPSLL